MSFKSVKAGDVLSIGHIRETLEDGKRPIIYKKWTVEKVYKDFVLCVCDGIRECFTYGELISLGYEPAEDMPDPSNGRHNRKWG